MTKQQIRDIYNRVIARHSDDLPFWLTDSYSGTWYTIRMVVRDLVSVDTLTEQQFTRIHQLDHQIQGIK